MKFFFTIIIISLPSKLSIAQSEIIFGEQIWSLRNLNVDTFRDGERIPEAKSFIEWRNFYKSQKPAWCYYDFDSSSESKYGKLYNWYAINFFKQLAPLGWRVPSIEDWKLLLNYFENSDDVLYKKQKKIDQSKGEKNIRLKYEETWELNRRKKNNIFWLGQLGGSLEFLESHFYYNNSEAYWWSREGFFINLSVDKALCLRPRIKCTTFEDGKVDFRGGYSVRLIKEEVVE